MAAEEIRLDVAGYKLAGLHKRAEPAVKAPIRLLCVHGWLDNANSFLPLFPYLEDFEIIAIDLPGHGHSSAIGDNAHYQLAETALLLPQIVSALGWQSCHLVGHSLGGNLSTLAVNASPTHFKTLTLLESLGPLSEDASELPGRLQKALEHRIKPERFTSRTFESPERAIETRLAAAKMTEAAAKLIIDRQLLETPQGWQWRFDPKYRLASSFYLTEAQVCGLLSAIEIETMVVVAAHGYLVSRDITEPRLGKIRHLHKKTVPGNHHMHMDDPAPTAQLIREFTITYGAKSQG